MKRILEGLHSVEGVQGSLVVEGTGQILAFQAHALYDASLLEQVARTIISAVDAIQLLHPDWESVNSSFTDGNLSLRNLKPGGPAAGRTVVLGLIADTRLNASFAGVAIRVAATKLKNMIENPAAASALGSSLMPAAAVGPASTPPLPAQNVAASSTITPAPSDLASSGLSWSGLGSSMRPSSEIQVSDPASSAFLTACTKALAASVGPMAKVFVKDAVRKLCPDRPFSRSMADALVALLRAHIEDPEDLAQFQKKMRAYTG